MSRSLMERAKAMLGSKGCAAALAVVPLAAVVNQTRAAVIFTLNNHSASFPGYGGNFYPANDFTASGTPIPNGIKLSGQFGPISGSSYQGNPTTLDLSGSFTGTIPAGQNQTTRFNFTPTFSGGTAAVNSITSNVGGLNAGASPNTAMTSGVPYTASIQSSPAGSHITNGPFDVQVNFSWSSFAVGDSFTLNIPTNSIDVVVPEPLTGTIFFLPALAWLAARRQRHDRVSSQAP
jgi:hypothetical protein